MTGITREQCDDRHGSTDARIRMQWRWIGSIVVSIGILAGMCVSAACVGYGTSNRLDVHEGRQQEWSKHVTETLVRIEKDVKAIRNGHP